MIEYAGTHVSANVQCQNKYVQEFTCTYLYFCSVFVFSLLCVCERERERESMCCMCRCKAEVSREIAEDLLVLHGNEKRDTNSFI